MIVFQNDSISFHEESDVLTSGTAAFIQCSHSFLEDALTHKRRFDSLQDIVANGSIASITAWANCAFYNPEH